VLVAHASAGKDGDVEFGFAKATVFHGKVPGILKREVEVDQTLERSPKKNSNKQIFQSQRISCFNEYGKKPGLWIFFYLPPHTTCFCVGWQIFKL
jgi:hypothetical protein